MQNERHVQSLVGVKNNNTIKCHYVGRRYDLNTIEIGMTRRIDVTIIKRELYSEFIYPNDRYFNEHIAIILTLKALISVNVGFFFAKTNNIFIAVFLNDNQYF